MRQELPLFVSGRIGAKIWIEISYGHAQTLSPTA